MLRMLYRLMNNHWFFHVA